MTTPDNAAAANPSASIRKASWRNASPRAKLLRTWQERAIEFSLFLAAMSSVAITVGIIGLLLYESSTFFEHVSLWEFFTGTEWYPLFEPPSYGIMPLLAGTFMSTLVALAVALPIGTVVAVYLSEFAPAGLREVLKPILELLSAVPTVVYGYFALLFVGPILQQVIPGVPFFSVLTAGIVMGIMIIPYVTSLSEDAMRAVPVALREGSYALGANRTITAFKVVFPAALSGIVSSYILAISRAVGETMIVAIAAGMKPNLTWDPREGAATITAYIVQVSGGELPHGSVGYQSIFAAGVVLFFATLAFNIIGYLLQKRYREAY